VIAESVVDLETHERLLGNGGYRPPGCRRCGRPMHIHEYRGRLLLGDPGVSTDIAIFQCADREGCRAVTRVLPAFLARHLWRAWPTVEGAVAGTRDTGDEAEVVARAGPLPERTVRRWRARLASSAVALVVVLGTAASTVPELHRIVQQVGFAGTRGEFVDVFMATVSPPPGPGVPFATPAAVIHRLVPGVRLM